MIFNKGNTPVNFEELLLSEASRYRMYPSEKVWENIRKDVQPHTKWPALITIFVIIVFSLTVATIVNYPKERTALANTTITNSKEITTSTLQVVAAPVFYSQIFYEKKLKVNTNQLKVVNAVNTINEIKDASHKTLSTVENETNHINISSNLPNNNSAQVSNSIVSNNNYETQNHNLVDDFVKQIEVPVLTFNSNAQSTVSTSTLKINEDFLGLKKSNIKVTKSKFLIQYYATVSNSYRTLDDDKSRSRYLSALADRLALNKNVNDVVMHKPMTGAEIGASLLYPISKNLFIKTGLQFNIRQYNIDAFNAYGEANINYIRNNQLNTFSTISGYSTNFENALGAKTNLQNKLYEISIPIGLEWNVFDGEKWGLNLTGSIEPTLALNRNNYIVSTDYKYYTDAAPFFRQFNINASSGMFFTMKTKKLKWFLGPQIRFQQLPTYNDLYPIKEYRVDYGIKIGFTKPLH